MTVAPTWEAPPVAQDDEGSGAAPGNQPRRWTPRRVVGLLLLASLLAAAAGGAWWWRHPEPAFTGSYGMRAVEKPGETVWTALVGRADADSTKPVRITELEPLFPSDEQTAWVDYLVCDLDRQALERGRVDGFGDGGGDGKVDRMCVRTAPAEGEAFPASDGRPQALLIGITPSQKGVAQVSGHRVSYRDGWQWAIDDVDIRSRILVRR